MKPVSSITAQRVRPAFFSIAGMANRIGIALALMGSIGPVLWGDADPGQMNVVWIIADDAGPALGCYGEPLVRTPNLDRMAREGTLFANAFTTASVCSPSRSAMFTGRYQTAIGAHQHRALRRDPLPEGVLTITDHFRKAGYFTVNLKPQTADPGGEEPGSGKTDFNFAVADPYDGSDWTERGKGQPFFAHVNILAPHRGSPWEICEQHEAPHLDSADVILPPYVPDHPVFRQDYINYLKAIELMDAQVGRVLDRLEREGLLDRSILIFMGDNGECLFRSKQFLYDGGLHVPLIIRFPSKSGAGTVDERLVSAIDVTATAMGLAGIAADPGMHGRDLFDPKVPPREFIFAARDRTGLAVDRMRAVRSEHFKYIRNYLFGTPYMQVNPYKEQSYPTWNLLKQLAEEGRLTPEQALFTADRKPVEELYDLQADPHEVNNLASDPASAEVLRRMRMELDRWIETYGDCGAMMEDPLEILRGNQGSARAAGMTPVD